jgi:peptide-methionine (S)-S-oxide reductase
VLFKIQNVGCFWGMEMAFQRVPGVLQTEVGYTQGSVPNPSSESVQTGTTGHVEAVRIVYDTDAISYEELLQFFWDIIDPTTLNFQGNDTGTQYRSGIYCYSDQQQLAAEKSREELQKTLENVIVTEIKSAEGFPWFPAEQQDQRYLEKGGQCGDKGCSDPIRCYGKGKLLLLRRYRWWLFTTSLHQYSILFFLFFSVCRFSFKVCHMCQNGSGRWQKRCCSAGVLCRWTPWEIKLQNAKPSCLLEVTSNLTFICFIRANRLNVLMVPLWISLSLSLSLSLSYGSFRSVLGPRVGFPAHTRGSRNRGGLLRGAGCLTHL